MLVLKIIGVLLFCGLIYLIILKLNSFSIKRFNYLFFSSEVFFLYCVIYGLLFFGQKWYFDAIKDNGDILNGILIFSFGVILLLIRLVLNIKVAKFFMGLLFTILQLIIYLPMALGAFFVLIFILLAASQVKPVWNVNSK